ncbi:MAG: histidine phosphotransferase [Prochlorococcus sp. SP3034]|nr:histidine phosphotransferase [Prochlorococcus sp. SP3034]|tara:strand:- start:547 stop:1176 length:630 start_codon:yes stop_codon:yes gene_type:complete
MPFENNQRITRRRSSAGPTPPRRPSSNSADFNARQNQGPRPTFLTLRDHGKVFVADLPNLSDGQLAHISKEANEVLNSLEKRLDDLENDNNVINPENDTLIKASTKRDVTLRFIKSIEEEQEHRRNNPALRDAASESLPRTFLEVARHRLPGATFDSLLREALEACAVDDQPQETVEREKSKETVKIMDIPSSTTNTSLVVNIDTDSNK